MDPPSQQLCWQTDINCHGTPRMDRWILIGQYYGFIQVIVVVCCIYGLYGLYVVCRYGSITQASTVRLGMDEKGSDVFVAMSQLLPMLHPDDLGMLVHTTNLSSFAIFTKRHIMYYNLQA